MCDVTRGGKAPESTSTFLRVRCVCRTLLLRTTQRGSGYGEMTHPQKEIDDQCGVFQNRLPNLPPALVLHNRKGENMTPLISKSVRNS